MSSTARTALLAEWDRCRGTWNECVAKSRQVHAHNRAHPDDKLTCGPAQLDKTLTDARTRTPWLREGTSVPQQQTIRDFAKARAKALKDIDKRLPVHRRAGTPRHKKKRQALLTLNRTTRGFRLKGGRLHLAGGTAVTVVWSRELPATSSSVRVYRDGPGHWYASFVVVVVAAAAAAVAAGTQPLPATGAVIGVDWGVRGTATTSDTHDLPHVQQGKTAAQRLARCQRMMARRRPAPGQAAPRGCRTAQRQTAKAHKKVARQRTETARKWAKKVIRDHDAIAVEDFRPRFLAKTTMARKAVDAAIAATKAALIEMGREHGRDVRLVHPAHTTMDRASCGAGTKHALPPSERIHTCTACGTVSTGDRNSARVMLLRAGLDPAGAEGTRPPGAPLPEGA